MTKNRAGFATAWITTSDRLGFKVKISKAQNWKAYKQRWENYRRICDQVKNTGTNVWFL